MSTFYENYLDLCNKKGISPSAAANDMKFSNAAVNGWKNGKVPRDATLRKIADYFNVSTTELLGTENSYKESVDEYTQKVEYYLNPETAEIAQEIFENKELRALFDVSRDSTPEDLKFAQEFLLAMKRKETGSNDIGC